MEKTIFLPTMITAVDIREVAWDIGPDKDSLSLRTLFMLNVEEGNASMVCSIVKNAGSKGATSLLQGTPKECLQYVEDYLAKLEDK